MQKKIHSGLQVMGFSVTHEHQVGKLPMHLDMVTKGQGKNGEQHTVAVEVDGPTHFVHTAAGPHTHNSATRFRNAALLLHHVHVRPQILAKVQDPDILSAGKPNTSRTKHLLEVNGSMVQVIPVSYSVWDRVGISGQGLHHEVNQRSWLRSELRKRGVVFPVRVAE